MCDEEMNECNFDDSAIPEPIYLDYDDFHGYLPALLNSSATRKKTMDTLFLSLRNRVYRCKEFPKGIFVNEFGELCPDDVKSGIYYCTEVPNSSPDVTADDEAVDNDPDIDNDNDLNVDEADEYWKQEEMRVSLKKTTKRKRDPVSESDEEYNEKDVDYEESEDGSEYSEDDDEDDEDDYDDEEYCPKDNKDTNEPTTKTLSTAEKKCLYLAELEVAAVETHRIHDNQIKKDKQYLIIKKLLKKIEIWCDEWSLIRNDLWKRMKSEKKGPKPHNPTIRMSYDSFLTVKTPGCDFEFRKPYSTKIITAKLDCDKSNIICECGESFSATSLLYTHISNHFKVTTPSPKKNRIVRHCVGNMSSSSGSYALFDDEDEECF